MDSEIAMYGYPNFGAGTLMITITEGSIAMKVSADAAQANAKATTNNQQFAELFSQSMFPMWAFAAFVALIIITLTAIEIFLKTRRKDRFVSFNSVTIRKIIIYYLIFCFITMLFLILFREKSELIIGIHTGLIGVAAGWYFNIREKFNDKTVYIISKSKNNFSDIITKACQDRLQTEPRIKVKILVPDTIESYEESPAFQERVLTSPDVLLADAVVILVAEPTTELTGRTIELQNLGVYVVLCDHKLSNDLFFRRNIFPPSFVTSNFQDGGRLIGSEIAISSSDPEDLIVVMTGPRFSGPGSIRSENCIKAIVRAEKLQNLQIFEISTWHPKETTLSFIDFVKHDLLKKTGILEGKSIYVFCGNDEICRDINTALEERPALQKYKWNLYGYDGIKDNSGTYMLASCQYVRATIDQKVIEIGQQVGSLLIEKHKGISSANRRRIIVEPALVKFSKNVNDAGLQKVAEVQRPSPIPTDRPSLRSTQRVVRDN